MFALLGVLLALAGGVALWASSSLAINELPPTTTVGQLESGVIARMDNPLFVYSPGWQVNADGANPPEPLFPSITPAGVITFSYTGAELALKLATGDYWGYLYVTVDHEPANLLPVIPGNTDSMGNLAGYKPLYEPENAPPTGTGERWLRVHSAADPTQSHEVRIEVWRSWAATPLRAVGVDALPPPAPARWLGMALLIAAFWCILFALSSVLRPDTTFATSPDHFWRVKTANALLHWSAPRTTLLIGGCAVGCIALATTRNWWTLCVIALAVLAAASVQRPMLWFAALFFGLPFYYTFPLPLTPARSFGLVDVGVVIGLAITLGHWLLRRWSGDAVRLRGDARMALLLGLIASWALISAVTAKHLDVALREWRILFFYGALLFFAMWVAFSLSPDWRADLWLLVSGWLSGAAFVSLIALAFYQTDLVAFNAEGVRRLHGFYGSPNNLALYLGRTLAVTLALALFAVRGHSRLFWAALALPQLIAFLLTFSKGALLIALPALLLILWLGGLILLRRRGQSTRSLWWLAVAVLALALVVTPVVGAERFQRLFDFSQGTSFLRINLWRSSLQMGLDHFLWGVGPDNFLYTYRSGYILPEAWQEPNLNHPHNWVLDWWTRLGLFGLALGLTWWGIIVAHLVRNVGCDEVDHAALRLGLLAAVVAALAHGLIDASYALPDLMAAWVLITFLAIALGKQRPAPTSSSPDPPQIASENPN